MKINYQLKLEEIINTNLKNNFKQKLLLHVCCAPCSSYVLEYLSKYFEITIFYYNPNIYPESEYFRRLNESKEFTNNVYQTIKFIEDEYNTSEYYDFIKGFENEKEGSIRCFKCYELRLKKAALYAIDNGFDYFTTTLSISPYKNSQKLNEIGTKLEEELGIKYLYADFKKNNGYFRSIELSKQYNLYRQDYCGCIYSKIAKEKNN